ncbi:hypothetical protein AJ80_08356 [Polytolypa hystricis UAMH7299]|uniref:ADP-ribosylation factor n=1 Tax=Polytolypa hystricis (strain UAMH7299) TaxID=1447883 RepID=A0A2B7X9R9_POLH7|nr:hypothetical protein AJ80_08356 [Polytolypa hystricis UAMH7299]
MGDQLPTNTTTNTTNTNNANNHNANNHNAASSRHSTDTTTSSPPTTPVSLLSLSQKFLNLDEKAEFLQCRQTFMNEATRNFIVEFGDTKARCAFDLEGPDFEKLVQEPKPLETRWINIWAPELQKDIVQIVTSHYGVSARLQAMMGSGPASTKEIKAFSPRLTSDRPSRAAHNDDGDDDEDVRNDKLAAAISRGDLENGYPHAGPSAAELQSSSSRDSSGLGSIDFSHIVNQIWHFVSVDYGQRYLCLGYNSLYVVPGVDFHNSPSRPDGKRLWSWLILCDDGTVVSIQENPFPDRNKFTAEARTKALGVIRRNSGLILSGLSTHHGSSGHNNPLMTSHVRYFQNDSGKPTIRPAGEGASLLFYYLFDDWVTSYSLVIRREHSYSSALEKLRKRMVDRPQVELIDDLHRLGRQLAVLKRIYQSYELILNRLLKRQRLLREENRNHGPYGALRHRATGGFEMHMRNDTFRSTMMEDASAAATDGVQLSFAAIGRFERLADRIRLYALSEIEECVNEKESLTFLVLNLIAVKDSQAVEKLTRTTILIAKATILFLPVSLMTAYFSTEIKELEEVFTVRMYWIAFAVILVLSTLLLYVFGWLGDALGGRIKYRSIPKTMYDATRTFGQQKQKMG